ncbi:MAG: hypothetical protein SAK29_28005, partial [Scytonema sp. PMC 1069.18]|nr:hypothetical protein [Scytonema sp. PMC 1069.18]
DFASPHNLTLIAGKGNVNFTASSEANALEKLSVDGNNVTVSGSDNAIANNVEINAKNDIEIRGLKANRDVMLEADRDIITYGNNSRLEASRDLKLQAGRNINLQSNQLHANRDTNIIAANKVEIRDDTEKTYTDTAAIITAGRNLLIQGEERINIQAFKNPDSIFESGNNLTLISNGVITGNVKFFSGGNFSTISVGGSRGNFQQTLIPNFDSIISSEGDVSFGNYDGLSLKVEAKGSITGGDITINDSNPNLTGSDPDIPLLTQGPGLVLRAGVDKLQNTPNISNQNVGGTNFTSPGKSSSANITVGDIDTSVGGPGGSVTMSATGNINTGHIITAGNDYNDLHGFVDLQATGNIEVKTISTNTNTSGDIKIIAGGLFRATDSFLVPDNSGPLDTGKNIQGEKVLGSIPTSIYATQLDDPITVSIQHGGRSFIIGPQSERDADGKLVFRDDNGNLLPYTVDALSGFVRDADNNILTDGIVIGSPVNEANIGAFTSFTAGAITIRDTNSISMASFRDSTLESTNNTFYVEKDDQIQITFNQKSIPEDTSSGSAEVQVPVSSDQQSIPDDGQIQVTFDSQPIPEDTSLESSNNTSSGATEGQVSVSSDQQSISNADTEAVQRQLTRKEQNNICDPKSSTAAFNRTENTRSGRTTDNSQSANNVPCKTSDNNNNILKVIPDTRFDSNSALPATRLR